MENANYFSDLSEADQNSLLDYIISNFKMIQSINHEQTAYGLKARYNRLTGANKGHHVTSRCFMEAMVKEGYRAVPVKGAVEPNWYFNVGKTHFTD
ncbi:hypothetical protein [Lacrimispora sp. JR3]|uniref:hypothetical protein n=1 Tax=Lacrimispora sinapis TaxID=3111456 RepID=UPI003748DE71